MEADTADQLCATLRARLARRTGVPEEAFQVHRCHWWGPRLFAPWAGFELAQLNVLHARTRGETGPAVLIVGLHAVEFVAQFDSPAAVLEFPAIRYLPYLSTDAELEAALRAAVPLVSAPLPPSWKEGAITRTARLLASVAHGLRPKRAVLEDAIEGTSSVRPLDSLPSFASVEHVREIERLANDIQAITIWSPASKDWQEIPQRWLVLRSAWESLNEDMVAATDGRLASRDARPRLQQLVDELATLLERIAAARVMLDEHRR